MGASLSPVQDWSYLSYLKYLYCLASNIYINVDQCADSIATNMTCLLIISASVAHQ